MYDESLNSAERRKLNEAQEELNRYKSLATNLIEASERMDVLRQSLEVLGLCKTTNGIMNATIEMIQKILPIEHYNVYTRHKDKWNLSEHSPDSPTISNHTELDWVLTHSEPSVMPVGNPLISHPDIQSYLLFPLRTPRSMIGSVVVWFKKKAGDLPQSLMRMLSALNAEIAISLGNVQSNEQLRTMNTYLSQILESLPQAVFTLNMEGEVKVFNHNAEVLFEKEALLIIDEKYQSCLPKEFIAQIKHVIPHVHKGQKFNQLKIENDFSKNTSKTFFSLDVLPIFEGENRVHGILMLMN